MLLKVHGKQYHSWVLILYKMTDARNYNRCPDRCVNFSLFQAFVGVAFSVGFVFGPIIGAVFSRFARDQQEQFYTTPALFALALAVIDIGFILMFFKETLPEHKRVSNVLSPVSLKEHFFLHLILIYCDFSI